MKNVKVDDFCKWTSHDIEGQFSHVGQVSQIGDGFVILNTEYGLMKVAHADGKLERVERPDNWGMARVIVTDTTEHVPTIQQKERTPRTPRESNGESKKDKALALYKGLMIDGQHPKRADVIKLFIEQLNMTPAGASTYQNICKGLV